MKTQLKTPISYYGGKQSMLNAIFPMIPEHTVYCEPFFGGGAVFWSKEPKKLEYIPHSLSYHATTLMRLPPTTSVSAKSTIAL